MLGQVTVYRTNLVLFFRFSSWATYTRDQFLAVYLRVNGGVVTPVSIWGGDMQHPVNGLYGQENGVIMSGTISSDYLYISAGQLPSSEDGYLQGSTAAFIAFVAPALPGETQVIYSANVYIDFNVPIIND
jgi:hypothetical protein